jgi:hypothetical protein
MHEQVIAWAGLALLAVLCLPFAGLSKLVLEVSAWALRLALLALLAAAAYLVYDPTRLPSEVVETVNSLPRVKAILPDPAAPYFGTCAAALVALALLPLLAVFDVTRKLAGRRLCRLRALTTGPVTAVTPTPVSAPPPQPAPVLRRVDRRSAADVMAAAVSRRPARGGDRSEP